MVAPRSPLLVVVLALHGWHVGAPNAGRRATMLGATVLSAMWWRERAGVRSDGFSERIMTQPGSVHIAQAIADTIPHRARARLGRDGDRLPGRGCGHQRKVALKVLLRNWRRSWETSVPRRIRTTATLQHPNILPLFDSGTVTAFVYYVMPYVAGESLRDRLDREGQLAVDAAVKIATAVADALDYAHRQGVVHRDIKPENILLKDGHALVADFGIALAVTNAGGSRLTQTGLSLGTPHYMSPEQAGADRTPDAAAILLVRCRVLEMLAGEPPFSAPTTHALLNKLSRKSRGRCRPPENRPSGGRAAVHRALEKLPADRWVCTASSRAALAQQIRGNCAAVTTRAGGYRPR